MRGTIIGCVLLWCTLLGVAARAEKVVASCATKIKDKNPARTLETWSRMAVIAKQPFAPSVLQAATRVRQVHEDSGCFRALTCGRLYQGVKSYCSHKAKVVEALASMSPADLQQALTAARVTRHEVSRILQDLSYKDDVLRPRLQELMPRSRGAEEVRR